MLSRLPKFLSFIFFAAATFFSIVLYGLTNKYDEYVMFFVNSRTKEEVSEKRYCLKKNIKEPVVAFVEELMLGSMYFDNYDFVDSSTKYRSCFVSGKDLYLDLPESVYDDVTSKMDFARFFYLVKKNINVNFPSIKQVYLSLNGQQVYEIPPVTYNAVESEPITEAESGTLSD